MAEKLVTDSHKQMKDKEVMRIAAIEAFTLDEKRA